MNKNSSSKSLTFFSLFLFSPMFTRNVYKYICNCKESLANRFNRRKSVFAESYDPEGDDDEGEKVRILHNLWCVGLIK